MSKTMRLQTVRAGDHRTVVVLLHRRRRSRPVVGRADPAARPWRPPGRLGSSTRTPGDHVPGGSLMGVAQRASPVEVAGGLGPADIDADQLWWRSIADG